MNDVFAQRLGSNRQSGGGTAGPVFIAFFGIFSCTLVGAFDYMVIRDLVWQMRSAHFVSAPAHIVKGEVTSHHGSKGGTTYGVAFEYTYIVDGSNYVGNRYLFNRATSSDRADAGERLRHFREGSDGVCYYHRSTRERSCAGHHATTW